jgi:hypothetical protein
MVLLKDKELIGMHSYIQHLEKYGFEPVHLWGNWWLRRKRSNRFSRFSIYYPIHLPKE